MTFVTSFCHHRNGLRPWVPVEHSEGHLLRIRKTLHATNIPYVFSLVGYIPFRSGQTGTKNSGAQLVALNRRSCGGASRGKVARAERKMRKTHEKNYKKYFSGIKLVCQLRHLQRAPGLTRLRVSFMKDTSFLVARKFNFDGLLRLSTL